MLPHRANILHKVDSSLGPPDKATLTKFVKENYKPFVSSSKKLPDPDPQALCILDMVNGQLAIEQSIVIPHHVLRLTGWAVVKPGVTPPASLILENEETNKIFVKEAERFPRQDVAEHLGSANYLNAGYDVEGSILDLEPGSYKVAVGMHENGHESLCAFGKNLVVNK